MSGRAGRHKAACARRWPAATATPATPGGPARRLRAAPAPLWAPARASPCRPGPAVPGRAAGEPEGRRGGPGRASLRTGTKGEGPPGGAGRTGRRAAVHSWLSSARNGEGGSPPTTCTDTEPARQPHVENPALLLDVGRQAVGEQARRHLVEHYVGPLPALDPVDRGQHHAVDGAGVAQRPPEPVLEPLRLGVQGRQGHQRVEVVGLGRAVQAPARALQQFHGPVEAYVVAHRPQDGGGGAGRSPPVQHLQVRNEARDLVAVTSVEAIGQPLQPSHPRLLAHPLDDFGRQARDGRRAARDTSAPARRSGDDTARRSHASAAWTPPRLRYDTSTAGRTGTWRCTSATCTGASEALTRASTATSPGAAPLDTSCATRSTVEVRGSSPVTTSSSSSPRPVRRGHDVFLHPVLVVGQQGPGRLDDAHRAAVIDMERVLAGRREKAVEVDQPLGRGTRVAVDRLVVVTHAEHGALGRPAAV